MGRCLKPVARRIGAALTQSRVGGQQRAACLPVAEAEPSAATYAFPG